MVLHLPSFLIPGRDNTHPSHSGKQTLPAGQEVFLDLDILVVSKTDPHGHITYVNRAFMRLSGYAEQALLGQPHNIVRHPGMPRCLFQLMWNTIQGGKDSFVYPINMVSDNNYHWTFSHITLSFDPQGAIIAYHAHGRAPARAAVEGIIPLYTALLAEEAHHADPEQGMITSLTLLPDFLAWKGSGYDEFVLSL